VGARECNLIKSIILASSIAGDVPAIAALIAALIALAMLSPATGGGVAAIGGGGGVAAIGGGGGGVAAIGGGGGGVAAIGGGGGVVVVVLSGIVQPCSNASWIRLSSVSVLETSIPCAISVRRADLSTLAVYVAIL
jgi:hypothetical protein